MKYYSTDPRQITLFENNPLELHHDWHCFCQAGDFETQDEKCYFEAFPRLPSTYIRGTGMTIIEAEDNAWKQWEKIQNCPGHEMERRGYENGAGFCKHCDMFKSRAFEPMQKG